MITYNESTTSAELNYMTTLIAKLQSMLYQMKGMFTLYTGKPLHQHKNYTGVELLFTHKNGEFGRISVIVQSCVNRFWARL